MASGDQTRHRHCHRRLGQKVGAMTAEVMMVEAMLVEAKKVGRMAARVETHRRYSRPPDWQQGYRPHLLPRFQNPARKDCRRVRAAHGCLPDQLRPVPLL